jgi:S-adenosylmethionine/arginine decarboxylase-like enzyme
LTAVQIIVTSTIVAHFIDSTGDLYLDVFSCKQFDVETVAETVDEFFKPTKTRINYLTRQAG